MEVRLMRKYLYFGLLLSLLSGIANSQVTKTYPANTVLGNNTGSRAPATALTSLPASVASIGQAINITNPTYGASTSGSSAANQTAIQAAINAAISAKVPLYIPAASACYNYTAPLTINGNLAIVGDYVAGNWSGGINVPLGSPVLVGSVLCPSSNGSDAIDITGASQVVTIENLGIIFQTPFSGTGDGIHYVPASTQGLSGSVWKHVEIYGHDGNHYAYNFANFIYDTFIELNSYGGGGFNLHGGGVTNAQYGNSTFIEPYVNVLTGGSANGYTLTSTSSTQKINLLTFIRPQANTNNTNGLSSGNLPTNAQYIFSQDANTTGVRLIGADLETNVSSPALFNWASGSHNDYDMFGMFSSAASWNSPAWGQAGPWSPNPSLVTINDTTSSGTVATMATFSPPAMHITASSATTYTVGATLYVSPPIAGTNVSITRNDAIYATGEIFTTSDLGASGGAFITGTVNLNKNNSAVTEIGDGTDSSLVTIGGGSNGVVVNGNQSGYVKNTALISTGTKFTTSACSISATSGGAAAGTFTLGANSCTAVITINGATGLAAPTGWSCQAHDRTNPLILIGGESASSTTTASFTIPATAGATDVISYSCTGF
jgi:hypothetical protein